MWQAGYWGKGMVVDGQVFTWCTNGGGHPLITDKLEDLKICSTEIEAAVQIAPDGKLAVSPAWFDRQAPRALRRIESSCDCFCLDEDGYWLQHITSDVSYA